MDNSQVISTRRLLNAELLQCYSIHVELISPTLDNYSYTTWLDAMI